MEGGLQSKDDLTYQLINIVKVNTTLESEVARGQPPHILESTEKLLQLKVANLFDNGAGGTQETQRSGKLLKTIRQRLKGKEGRIRGNLMGKRVDFSARTVITADPNLSMDQVCACCALWQGARITKDALSSHVHMRLHIVLHRWACPSPSRAT